MNVPTKFSPPGEPCELAKKRDPDDSPIRLSQVLFVLWVAGSLAWALFAALIARNQGWWEWHPELAAVLVLALLILGHVLANYLVRVTGNPTFRA